MKIKSVESYTDDDRQPTPPKTATHKYTSTINEDGSIGQHTTEISDEGFDEKTDRTVIIRYDLKSVSVEEYDETKHNRGGNQKNSGQFSAGSGGGGSNKSKQTFSTKKLERKTARPKDEYPFGNKPVSSQKVRSNRRDRMLKELSKHYSHIDIAKLLSESEKCDDTWQSMENLGLNIDNNLANAFPNFRVMHRTKDTFSTIEKLVRKPDQYKTIDDLTDRAGVRVINKNIQEVNEAIKYVTENYDVIKISDHMKGHSDGSGYRSWHCVVKVNGVRAEIQIRTENEEIWANIFHDLYKPKEARIRKALQTNEAGIKKYANDYSNYLYNIDCCDQYGTPPTLPQELERAGFGYSNEAKSNPDFFDHILGEIYEMTPDYGFNVVIFDDYSPNGEMLTLIGNFDNEQDAQSIKQQCEEQGKVTYIYKPDGTTESFEEDEHPRDGDGKFASKGGGGSVSEYKETTMKDVETKPEVKEIQEKLDKNVTNKVEDAIKELGIEDKIYDVAMQGSYEKGTDLPASGSDMDLFVVFNTDVSEEEKNQYGLEIGRKVLNKDFAKSQGWTDYYDEEVTATSKYVQAFFKDGEQDVEVQIVPTKHLTLEQIRERKLDGKDIEIGMERTPHQTEYMKTALKGKEGEVRVLKKFMKDAGLYGSNLKEQGFSGYSAEVLIDEYGSFENVIDFFADLKEGDVVDKQGGGKRNKENAFSIIDPIDPNRDLVTAFSTQKIGRTINVAKKFKETGKIPEPEYREMDSTTITFDSDEVNEDTLIGQVRKMAKSYQSVLGKMGFNVETNTEKVNDINVELPDFSFDAEWDNDKKKNIVKINMGSNNITIPKEYKDKGIPLGMEKAINIYKEKNKGLKFVEEDGKLKAIKKRQFTSMIDAVDYLNNNPEGKLSKSKQTDQIKSNGRVSTGKTIFTEAFQEQEHPRDGDGKFSTKGGGESPKSDILKKYLKKIPLSIPDKHNNKSIPLIKETDYLVDNKPSFITSDGIYLSNDIMREWAYPESHADILGHITGLNIKDIDTDKTAKVAGELNLVRVLIDTELTIHVTSKLSMSQLSQINKLVKEWTGEVDIEYDIGTDSGLDRFGTDDRKEFQNKLREKGWMAEAFVEQEHPRDGDGKFTSGGGKTPKEYEQTNKTHNDVENGSPIELKSNLKNIVSGGKFNDKTKKALNSIIDNWGGLQKIIAKDKGCTLDSDGNYKTYVPRSVNQNKVAGKSTNYMENVCASGSDVLVTALKNRGVKSNVVSGRYWGKGKAKNVDAYMKPPQDTSDGRNVVTDKLKSLGYDKFYSPLKHMWVTLEDGTIIDGAYGQFLNKVTDKHQRLQIITPDDPRNKWYVTNDEYLPEEKDFYLGGLEAFVEQEHPRDNDGQFTSKDGGGLNSRMEQKQSVITQQIDYLQKQMKPESQTYRAFQKVTDEDRSIRYTNKSLQEDINKLQEELNSEDTIGMPHLPLKQNTHAVQTIEGGMLWNEGTNEPLQGFKKGNTTIDVNIPLKRPDDDFAYNKIKAERQINTLRLMWNSLGDEERDIVKSFNIERTPKLIVETDKDGRMIYKNMDDVSTAGYWRPSKNQLNMRIDYDMNDDHLKGIFTHEIGHALWHSFKENNPERIAKWKLDCKKIPPTTKYGKYNKKRWTDLKKIFDEYEKEGWSEFPENERDEKRGNGIKNIAFYEDRYYNELHSEVFMYMTGNNKYKRGTITKGIEKFLEPYKKLHGLT